jgi:hypothetical protein
MLTASVELAFNGTENRKVVGTESTARGTIAVVFGEIVGLEGVDGVSQV